MQDVADSFYDDNSQGNNSSSLDKEKLELPKLKGKELLTKAHLYPIDETEDFHDPFSDLSLFLSKQIKSEVQRNGSSKQWSQKIEKDLLKKILPEFKVKFPKYRLGVSAVKKVWEKVSYYYGKVQTQKEAIKSDGKLNIEYMIKENLRGCQTLKPSFDMPEYNTAHQLAIKMSECIATLDGVRPRLDHLTKTIWAAQKHMLKSLPTNASKNAFEEYDNIDKLIVRMLLEKTAENHATCKIDLAESIKNQFHMIRDLVKDTPKENLYQNIAKVIAKKFYKNTSMYHLLNQDEKDTIYNFIQKQIKIVASDASMTDETVVIETMQRVLALYPLAHCLPRNLDLETVKQTIDYVYDMNTQTKPFPVSFLDQGLVAFIHAEMHFYKRKQLFDDYEEVQKNILETITDARSLPLWQESYQEELEIFIWEHFDSKAPLSEEESATLENEIANVLLDFPNTSFRNAIYHVMDFFKKTKDLLVKKESDEQEFLWDDIHHKIELWTVQNDMLCRWIHFDPNTPLLKLISSYFEKNEDADKKNHQEIVDTIFTSFRDSNPSAIIDESLLKARVWILYKYFWYHHQADGEESSLDRFIKWHLKDIFYTHSELDLEAQITILEKRLITLLPLTPFSRKKIERMVKACA
ncbi:MAG: hypothetical protein S4CHLAM37_13030 [Chlamydiia bacterium]|nr:hypothetical protein [Chlamydiia bacterium]